MQQQLNLDWIKLIKCAVHFISMVKYSADKQQQTISTEKKCILGHLHFYRAYIVFHIFCSWFWCCCRRFACKNDDKIISIHIASFHIQFSKSSRYKAIEFLPTNCPTFFVVVLVLGRVTLFVYIAFIRITKHDGKSTR